MPTLAGLIDATGAVLRAVLLVAEYTGEQPGGAKGWVAVWCTHPGVGGPDSPTEVITGGPDIETAVLGVVRAAQGKEEAEILPVGTKERLARLEELARKCLDGVPDGKGDRDGLLEILVGLENQALDILRIRSKGKA